jgi:hypothetical protein
MFRHPFQTGNCPLSPQAWKNIDYDIGSIAYSPLLNLNEGEYAGMTHFPLFSDLGKPVALFGGLLCQQGLTP